MREVTTEYEADCFIAEIAASKAAAAVVAASKNAAAAEIAAANAAAAEFSLGNAGAPAAIAATDAGPSDHGSGYRKDEKKEKKMSTSSEGMQNLPIEERPNFF